MPNKSGAPAEDSPPPPYSSPASESSEDAQAPPGIRLPASSARLTHSAYVNSDGLSELTVSSNGRQPSTRRSVPQLALVTARPAPAPPASAADPHSFTNSAPSLAHPHIPLQYLYSYPASPGSHHSQASFGTPASAYPYPAAPTPSTSQAYYSTEYPITHSPSPDATTSSPAWTPVSLSPASPSAYSTLDAGVAALSLTHSPQGSPLEAYRPPALSQFAVSSPGGFSHYAHAYAYASAPYAYSAPVHPQQGFYYSPQRTPAQSQSYPAPNGYASPYPYGQSSLAPPPPQSPDLAFRPRPRGGSMPPPGVGAAPPHMAATASRDSNDDESTWSPFRRSIEDGEHPMSRGTCKFFNPGIGFGYIVDDRAEELDTDVFVHYTGIDLPRGFRCLSQGERVEYVLTKNVRKNRIQALRVTGENGMPLIGVTGNPQHVRTIQRARRRPSNGDPASLSD